MSDERRNEQMSRVSSGNRSGIQYYSAPKQEVSTVQNCGFCMGVCMIAILFTVSGLFICIVAINEAKALYVGLPVLAVGFLSIFVSCALDNRCANCGKPARDRVEAERARIEAEQKSHRNEFMVGCVPVSLYQLEPFAGMKIFVADESRHIVSAKVGDGELFILLDPLVFTLVKAAGAIDIDNIKMLHGWSGAS